jgi:hypothetical protein
MKTSSARLRAFIRTRASAWLLRPLLAALPLATLAGPRIARAQYYVPAPPPPAPPAPEAPRVYYVREYHAEHDHALALGVDLEGAALVNIPTLPDGNQIQGGSGFKVRLGDQIRVASGFRITIEGAYAYDRLFGSNESGTSFDWDTYRLLGGLRFAFGRVIVPSIYGHLGFGWRLTGDPETPQTSGFAADAGGAIDLRLWRHLQFGLHAEYATLNTTPYAPQWIAMGAHVDVAF